MDREQRGLVIHFMDGTKMQLEFPQQTDNEYAAGIKLKEILAARELLVQCDGGLMVIPRENIKYMHLYPAVGQLPGHAIKAASIAD